MKPGQTHESRRVTVVIDTSLRGLAELDAAASLAARRKASLEALFVEDAALFQLAALPFARELDRASGAVRPMSPSNLEGGLRANLQRLRRAVDAAVAQRGGHATVRVTRGHYVEAALDASSSVDVLFLSRVRRIAYATRSSSLQPPRRLHDALCVVYDASDAGRRALDLAVELAEAAHAQLRVALLSDYGEDYATLRGAAEAHLGQHSSVIFSEACATDVGALRDAIGLSGFRLVLVPAARARAAASSAESLLEALEGPVVLVS